MATTITPLNLVVSNGDILDATTFNKIPTKVDQIVHALEDNGGIKQTLASAATAQSVSLLQSRVATLSTNVSSAQTSAAVADTKASNAATAAAAAAEQASYATNTANNAWLATTNHRAVVMDGIDYTLQNGDEMIIFSPIVPDGGVARDGTINLPLNYDRNIFVVKNASTKIVTLVSNNNALIFKSGGTQPAAYNQIVVASGAQKIIAYGRSESKVFYVEL